MTEPPKSLTVREPTGNIQAFQEEKSNCLGDNGWLREKVQIVVVVVGFFDLMSAVTLRKQPLVLEWSIQKPVFRNIFEISQSSSKKKNVPFCTGSLFSCFLS